jgi:hypothetical protein
MLRFDVVCGALITAMPMASMMGRTQVNLIRLAAESLSLAALRFVSLAR